MTSIVHMSVGGPDRKISVNGEIIEFEMHPHCGPILTGVWGDPLSNQKVNPAFWDAVTLWATQGQRIEDELCVWDHLPEPILKHLGGRNYKVLGYTEPRRGQ